MFVSTTSIRSLRAPGATERPLVACRAKKTGFGTTGTLKSQGKKQGKRSRPDRVLEEMYDGKEEGKAEGVIFRRAGKPIGENWFKLAELSDFKPGKNKCLRQTKTGKDLLLYKTDDQIYCSSAMSTAYEFPMVDAALTMGSNGPELEVPLDGTRYSLVTGEVIEWCPKNNPLRAVLGALKTVSTPVPLPVYDCVLTEADEIYVRLTRK